ncbi:MAG: transposase [Microgenomates group bacterium]
MPAKNRYKKFVDHTYYHIYNRGVEKRQIFEDQQDYQAFLGCLKLYLTSPKPVDRRFSITLQGPTLQDKDKTIYAPSRQPSNHKKTIELVSFCLMPNHFHLMLRSIERDSMTRFMRSLGTRYSMYFNKKYERVGPLFQGTYKAVMIEHENQFLWVTKYIHRNPLPLVNNNSKNLANYPYSSYQNYLSQIHQTWVHPENILSYFSKTSKEDSYQNFVEEPLANPKENAHLSLDS